jgi:hypothetical protein
MLGAAVRVNNRANCYVAGDETDADVWHLVSVQGPTKVLFCRSFEEGRALVTD